MTTRLGERDYMIFENLTENKQQIDSRSAASVRARMTRRMTKTAGQVRFLKRSTGNRKQKYSNEIECLSPKAFF